MKQKNKTRLARAAMTLLLALLTTFGAWAQTTTVTIGNGTNTQYYLPINMYYNYSLTQQIYTADEIGTAGTITSISFDYANSASFSMEGVQLYMMNVDKDKFESNTDMVQISAGDKVWEGTFEASEAGWVTIDLDTPFAYDGQSNLLVCFYDPTNGYPGIAYKFRTTATDDNLGIAYFSDGATPSLTDVSTYSGNKTCYQYRTNIILDITSGSVPTCAKPSTFEVSNITKSSAVFEWENTEAGSYTFEYKKASESEWTVVSGLNSNTYSLSSLMPGTAYSARVKAVCGTDLESGYKSVNFTTLLGVPFAEGFATSSIPTGWIKYTGLLSNVQNGGETLSTTSSGWSFGTNNGVFDSHARVNIYGTSCKYWLVTPSLLMENNVQLTFDLALTAYSDNLGAPQTTGTDDKFVVLITTDDGTTWTALRQWDNAGSEYIYNDIACSAVGQNVSIDLSSYAGQNIAIAFYGESTVSNADNNLHIDNVSIDYIPDCAKPTGLTVSNVTGHEATITWTSDADAWQIQLGDNAAIDVTDKTYTFTSLTPETAYSVKVRTDCGSGNYSDWTNLVNFTTTIACPAPTGLTTTLTPGDGSVATLSWTENGSATNWVLEYGTVADFTGATSKDVSGTPSANLTGLTAETTYYARVKAVCGGEDGESDWSNTVTFTPTNAYSLTVNDGTTTNSYVPVYGTWVDSYTKCQFIIPASELETMKYGKISKMTFYSSTANKTWGAAEFDVLLTEVNNSTFGDATLVNWEDMEKVYHGAVSVSDNKMEIVFNNNYQYMGGNLLVGFHQTVTGSFGSISWYGISSESSAIGGYESGAKSLGVQNFLPKTTFDYEPGVAPTCPKPTKLVAGTPEAHEVELSWTENGEATQWQICVNDDETNLIDVDEKPYTLTGLTSDTDYSVKVRAYCSADDQSGWSAIVTFTTAESCPKPTNLVAGTPEAHEVELSWTENGEATQWQICVNGDETNLVDVDEKPYTLTGLTSDTDYSVKVRAYCSADDQSGWSAIVTFTTAESCPKPTNLVAGTPEAHEVELSWTENGEATQWQICVNGDETNLVNVDENPYTLTGLSSDTDYSVKVRAYCSADDQSGWSATVTFTTAETCPKPTSFVASNITPTSATISWTGFADRYEMEYCISNVFDFDDGTLQGWTNLIVNEDGGKWLQSNNNKGGYDYTGLAHGGTGFALCYSFVDYDRAYDTDAYLISPRNYLINDGASLHFWYDMANDTYPEYFEVCIATTDNPTASDDFTSIWSLDDAKGNGGEKTNMRKRNTRYDNWREVTIDLSDYAGQSIWIAFHDVNNDMYEVWIDDITINPGQSDEITWIPVEGNITDTQYTLTDLNPETLYLVRVRAICDGEGESRWVMTNFMTLGEAMINFAAEGYATYYNSQKDVVLPDGMQAKIVTEGTSDGTLTYENIADGNIVHAGNAMLLQVSVATAANSPISIGLATPSAAAISGTNLLHGSDTRVDITTLADYSENDYYYYMLSYDTGGANIGWYWDKDNTSGTGFWSEAHKAWLALPKSLFQGSGAPFLGLPDWEDTTGIVPVGVNPEDGEWYTLQGLKIGKKPTTKGVYIHNGKKVLIP